MRSVEELKLPIYLHLHLHLEAEAEAKAEAELIAGFKLHLNGPTGRSEATSRSSAIARKSPGSRRRVILEPAAAKWNQGCQSLVAFCIVFGCSTKQVAV